MAVKRSSAKKVSATKGTAGPLLVNSDEGNNEFVKALLCGPPKTGKTTFACSWPDVLVIDADGGMKSVRGQKIPTFPLSYERFKDGYRYADGPKAGGPQGWMYVLQMLKNLEDQEGPFWDALDGYEPKTLVIDMLTSLSDLMIAEVIANPPDGKKRDNLQLQDYNLLQNRLYDIVNTALGLPMHVLCISGLEVIQDDAGRIKLQPNLVGKALGSKIAHKFDEVYEHGYDSKEDSYYVNTIPTRYFQDAGSRWKIKERISDPSYKKMSKYFK